MSSSKLLTVAALTAVALAMPVAAYAAEPTASTVPTVASAVDAHAAHHVRVVHPGQRVDIGRGNWMALTSNERCLGAGDNAWTCKSVTSGNQDPNSVSLQTSSDDSGTLYSPLYIGDGKAARMTVKQGGVTYKAQVVTLPGHPGYATGYVWGAPLGDTSGDPANWPTVTVYDARGHILAQL